MADEPKISKHHTGQHPALKSFRAFDIIPPGKVKPQHNARPVITSPVKHFDTTLTPPKTEESKPAPVDIETPEPADTSVAATSDPELAPSAETTAPVEPGVPTSTPEPTPAEVETPPTDPIAGAETPSSEPVKTDGPAIEAPQPELAVPESVPKPAPSAQAATEGDLNSILDQEAGPQTQLNHSQEFKNVLKEFTTQSTGDNTKPIVAVHQHDYLRVVMQVLTWLLIVAAIVAIIMDILLDTGALNLTYNIPHTHFFGK